MRCSQKFPKVERRPIFLRTDHAASVVRLGTARSSSRGQQTTNHELKLNTCKHITASHGALDDAMLDFMEHVTNAFYQASHWNVDNSYGALNATARGASPAQRPPPSALIVARVLMGRSTT